MKISVVTVCRNAAATVGRTIESFLRQDHTDKEMIVVDGNSRDGTVELVRSFGSAEVRLVSEPDRGMYDAANKGLALYCGDAVGMLNADDRFADDTALSAIAGGLATAEIAFGNLDVVADHETGRIVRRWQSETYRPGSLRRGWMPAHPTFYVRRAVVDAIGGFETRYRIAADYDFMLRALEQPGFRTAFVDRVLVKMMHGGLSSSGPAAVLRHNYEALKSRRQWLGAGVVDYATFAKPLRKLGQLY